MSSNTQQQQETQQEAIWCPEQQIYIGGTVPGEISDSDFQSFLENSNGTLPIFGYGSLCWNPGDGATLSKVDEGVTQTFGRAVGWKRCWCQRSADHRGTPDFQGLVCTLLSDEEVVNIRNEGSGDEKNNLPPTMTEGILYTVPASLVDECLEELDFREKGGYSRDIIQVEIANEENTKGTKTIQALLYRGTPSNPAFWKRPLMDLSFAAATMSVATGPSGPNDAYLYNLDTFLSSTETEASKDNDNLSSPIGDIDTKKLASMCREFQTKTLFFLYGSGSNQYEQLLLSNDHHKYLLSDDNNVHELTESVLITPKIPTHKIPGSTAFLDSGDSIDVTDSHVQPLKLYAGGGHSALLMNDGNLYLWGWNDDGQLGRPILTNSTNPNPIIEPLLEISVQKAALGHAHTLIIECTTGRVYGFGDNSRGQITGIPTPHPSNTMIDPITPEALLNEYFIDVSAGLFHSAGITANGEFITWGDAKSLPTNKKHNDTWTRWKPDDGSKLVKVVCGRKHTAVLDEHGRVWTMGDNKYGQLGRNSSESQSNKPKEPKLVHGILSRKGSGCIDISCGWSHCIALIKQETTSSNKLYGWGRNDKGQLGISSKANIMEPQCISIESDSTVQIQSIDCGSESSMFLNSYDNSLWSCGWNEHGNLSQGSCNDINEFQRIKGARISPTVVKTKGDKKILFAVGGGHMLALMT